MMRFSKTLLVVLGCVAALAFLGLMIYNVIQINQLHAVAVANRSAGFANPRNWVLIASGVGLLSGLLLGMGMAMPSKTFKARYSELRKAEQIVEANNAGYNGASTLSADNHKADPREK